MAGRVQAATTGKAPQIVRSKKTNDSKKRTIQENERAHPKMRPVSFRQVLETQKIGAGEGDRTLDPDLGKVVLYR